MTLSRVPSTLKPIFFFFCARTSLREVQDDGEAKFNKMNMEDMVRKWQGALIPGIFSPPRYRQFNQLLLSLSENSKGRRFLNSDIGAY